jgi:excisionase family DNA binding protein
MNELFEQFSEHLRPIIKAEVNNALEAFNRQLEAKPKDDNFYTRKETAKKLNVSLVTLTKHVYEGKITAHRVGHRVLFKAEDINNCLNKIKTVRGI